MCNFFDLISIVIDCLNVISDEMSYMKRHYPYGCYLDRCKDSHALYLYHDADKKRDILWTLSTVTGIDRKALIDAARIVNGYEEKHDWQKCFPSEDLERLVKGLME